MKAFKAVKVVMVAIFLLAGANLYAQSNSKVIAVVNKADWCGTCEKHGERVMMEVFSQYKESQVTITVNDLTNDTSKAVSKESLEKLGVYKLVENEKKTGLIIFIDRKSNKVISQISVGKSNEKIKEAFDKAIKKS